MEQPHTWGGQARDREPDRQGGLGATHHRWSLRREVLLEFGGPAVVNWPLFRVGRPESAAQDCRAASEAGPVATPPPPLTPAQTGAAPFHRTGRQASMPLLEGGARFAPVTELASPGQLASATSLLVLLAALAACSYALLLRHNLRTGTACGLAAELGAAAVASAAGGLAVFVLQLQAGSQP